MEANLTGTCLDGAGLKSAVYNKETLWTNEFDPEKRGMKLIEPNAKFEGHILREVNLQISNLKDARLRDVKLTGADLRKADLEGLNLWQANLGKADLK